MNATSTPKKITVRFEPIGAEIRVDSPISVMLAAAEAGIALEHPCGGLGVCGKCIVRVRGNHVEHSQADQHLLSPEELEQNCFLSCQTVLTGDTVIECQAGRETESGLVVIHGVNAPIELKPRVRRVRLEIPPPSLSDQRSDATRLLYAVKQAGILADRVHLSCLQTLPQILRDNQWRVSVICREGEIISVDPVGDDRRILGVAVDVGTTTVVTSLNDLETGEELSVRGAANEQLVYGQDVISRVNITLDQKSGIHQLQEKIIQTVDRMIESMLEETGYPSDSIYLVQAVGNSIMQQLFMAIDPAPIAITPFVTAVSGLLQFPAHTIGLESARHSQISVSPVIAGYVGGDIVADILATGIHQARHPSLLVDIGTNAEIVLGNKDRLMACSSPAGPAFEGGHIFHGMRGIPGAIEAVWVEDDTIHLKVIGDGDPVGICGSGLIDALAVLLHLEVVDETGRLRARDDFAGPEWIRERMGPFKKGHSFCLTCEEQKPIRITDKDVRALQLAKGAVQAGIRILLDQWGISLEELDSIFICGAFGSKINPVTAQQIGLIPPIVLEKVRFLGNTAHIGAKRMLLSDKELNMGVFISEKVCYFEVSGHPSFQDLFGLSLGFGRKWDLL
ncbi:MAG: DUF4445 domain-containing protein [Candidatus Omnitrophota bacterium]|jgi:uncharacterized 2Fe-2S/4Fe-4S cluster protein (DUF4445 family)|nr:MAG: DUF4445 domain-containing protein [Candidatus Omnitrophota bacterium]